jgi:hypothetical protein
LKQFSSLFLLLSICFNIEAQFFNNQHFWSKRRHEISFGAGITNFRGDLAVLSKNSGNLFLFDIEYRLFRHGISLDYRYNIGRRQAFRFNFFNGRVVGNDNIAKDIYRKYRNLSFSSNIFELSGIYEFYLFRPKPGSIYNLQDAEGIKSGKFDFYLFGGVGLFYFNPKAYGQSLRKLGTEGQGQEGQPNYYSPVALVIPAGFGASYYLNKQIKLGFEYAYRVTFTDYIDDVSTVYFDKEKIKEKNGSLAAYLSDPSSGENPGWTATGQQRGDPRNNDGYFSILLKLTYMISM